MPVQALTEAYSVLTRMPAPYTVDAAAAWDALDLNFVRVGKIVTLSAAQHLALLRRLASDGIAGGRTYDAIIAECAVRAGATVLLTFNPRHFDPAPKGLTVVVPS